MDVERAGQTGSVDHGKSADLEEFGKRFNTNAMLIHDKVCSVSHGRREDATPGLATRRRLERLDELGRRRLVATVLCGGSEFGAVLGDGHYVNGDFSGFAMHAHVEPLF